MEISVNGAVPCFLPTSLSPFPKVLEMMGVSPSSSKNTLEVNGQGQMIRPSAVQVVHDDDNVYFGFTVTDDYHEKRCQQRMRNGTRFS